MNRLTRSRTRGRKSGGREAGLTLVELMVSILLASILSGGLFYLLSGQSKTYDQQFSTLTVQENLWGAMEFIQRQIRLAGYGGAGSCPNGTIQIIPSGTVWPAFRHFNDCDIRSSTISSCSATTNNVDCTCSTVGFGSDSFAVVYADPSQALGGGLQAARITNQAGSSDNFFVTSIAGFNVCDLIMLWQPGAPSQPCTLLMITGLNASNNKITHSPSGSCGGAEALYNPASFPGSPYSKGSLVAKVGGTAAGAGPRYFSIDRTVTPPRLVTWVTTNANPSASTAWQNETFEVVADGIEDMQISWACNADADTAGNLTEGANASARQTDEWAHNTASDTVPNCGTNKVAAIRVTLIATSGQESGNAVPNARPGAEDNPAAGSKTRHVRARLTSIIRPRNIR
ncbi:MAG: prepilin-type N-terminal cleavage/methylation domain-containing protein [Myxococcales bacterium]|nr:prepilin-type N-terminal cleavage/methylation domain-containing protein [Myxococcales bacterium]